LIGLFGNLGMYSLGVPIGMFIDSRGPRPAVLGGSVLLAVGYFPLHQAYDSASGPVPLLCLFSFLSGLGGCMAFAAAVKTSALNWPRHRGTATAFPLAAFGLSAFFFSLLGGIFFPGDPSGFLMLLAAGTCGMTFVGFFFLKVYTHSNYQPLPGQNDSEEVDGDRPARLRRTSSKESKTRREPGLGHDDYEPGTSGTVSSAARESTATVLDNAAIDTRAVDETSSLLSDASGPEDYVGKNNVDLDRSHRVDIRGFRLLRSLDFWQLFLIMSMLAGIGLMTIK
jgi:MFS family permease